MFHKLLNYICNKCSESIYKHTHSACPSVNPVIQNSFALRFQTLLLKQLSLSEGKF